MGLFCQSGIEFFELEKNLVPENIGLDLIEAENFIQLFSLAFITELKIRKLLSWIPKGKKNR